MQAQNSVQLHATLDVTRQTLAVHEQISFSNTGNTPLDHIILNDWINAYADKHSLLGERFSDEFVRAFHLAPDADRGMTRIDSLTLGGVPGHWMRLKDTVDLIKIPLPTALLPGQKVDLRLVYEVKIPASSFTGYGIDKAGNIALRNWFLVPARRKGSGFVHYPNANLDDIANSSSDYEVVLHLPPGYKAESDLEAAQPITQPDRVTYTFSGKDRLDFSLYMNPQQRFESFRNESLNVLTDIQAPKVDGVQKAILIDRVMRFVADNMGAYPYASITVSQTDYDRNPFYGLNQLPSFLSPFPEDFLFELKFLKTYINNFLHNGMKLDARKDNYIYDGMQMYLMMQYIDLYRPEIKLMGSLAKWKILRSFHLINLEFNDQYSYYYMLMARKNLDQPLGDSKEKLIRFNEKIASKYRAGLSFKCLDHYLENGIVPTGLRDFYQQSAQREQDRADFEALLESRTPKDINWFFRTIIESRDLIDYKFGRVRATSEQIDVTVKNRTGTTVPIPVYGLKDNTVIFKDWYADIKRDSTFTLPRQGVDKLVLNYRNEVPEFNLRNNWRSLKTWLGNDRPYKFAFLKDLENPAYNQIIYVPTVGYNFYDGISPGLRLSNKTLLDKPFVFDVNPMYAMKVQKLTGNFGLGYNQYLRSSDLFSIRYGLSGSYFHYAPDAAYFKLNPSINLFLRERDLRDNKRQSITARYSIVRKDPSLIVIDSTENYSVFALRYANARSTITQTLTYNTDVQFSSAFGKISGEWQYRKLLNSNRQFNIRFFGGAFLYNKTETDYYDFGVARANDYLFDYGLLGRSETSGLLSQQFIMTEGGFKSMVRPALSNQWMATTNISASIWNWVEAYTDLGLVKNHRRDAEFVYDTGIRLNLVTDYFELYFPVYSNLGWEIAQQNYHERVRFVITLSPKTLINLFTRKWF